MSELESTADVHGVISKPRLVFFRSQYGPDVPDFLVAHSREHIRCLEESFQVAVVSGNCDYDQVCDAHKPDLSAFEIGLQIRDSRPTFSNTHTHRRVPRIGLLNADAWGATRSVVLSDVESLELDAVFSISTTAGEHLPAIADRLFYWPNFIDPSVFRDYGLPKLVPAAITGAQNASYPWRQAVYPLIASAYPTIVCPHLGYSKKAPAMQMLHGEPYARVLASAWFSPSCGTAAREVVRKLLEIPACRTALITESCPSTKLAGFVDMENCVFAGPRDVLDRINYLFENRDQLEQLIDAGHRLVMSRHTVRNRTQVAEWFALSRAAGPAGRLVQGNPFGSLSLANPRSDDRTLHLSSTGLHLELIRQGDALLKSNRTEAARTAYTESLRLFDTMAEPKLRLAVCDLLDGKPEEALRRVVLLIKNTLSEFRDVDPDPGEWAYLVVCLLCLGRNAAARRRAAQYPHLSHPDLDRIRTAVAHFPHGHVGKSGGRRARAARGSLHTTLQPDFGVWHALLRDMLTASGQAPLAETIWAAAGVPKDLSALDPVRAHRQSHSGPQDADAVSSHGTVRTYHPIWRTYLPGSGLLRGFDNPLLWTALVQRGRIMLSGLFQRGERIG